MDTKLKELIINEVTEEKLKELEDANAIPPNELFVTEDEDDALIVDEALDANSVNPIANKIVAQKFTEITPSTTFAEAERQKSKNLFNINANPDWLQGCTLSRTEDTLTFNTTSSNGKFGYKVSGLTVGKQYTVSVQDISYANSLGLHIDYSSNSDTANFGRVTTTNKSVTFTASADFVYIKGYASYASGNTMIVKKLQLEEGTIVTDYQPYSGAIVHENNTIFERAENKIRSFVETTDPEKYLSMQALTEFNRYGYRYNFTGETADELLNWIQNSAPQGFYTFYWPHGTVNGVEVMKASSQYAQVRVVYYFTPEYQVNKLEAGRWTGWKSISGA